MRDEQFQSFLTFLANESGKALDECAIHSNHAQFEWYRAVVNARPAQPVPAHLLTIQDKFLQDYQANECVTLESINPTNQAIVLWQGDITRLAVDAIVNPANSELLGCFIPLHNCLDNQIHSKAGIQLRLECSDIMAQQGKKEAVGRAKLTKAYNLPSKYVIHTVGPYIAQLPVSQMKQQLLQQCYWNCLRLADEHALHSLALCAISTGEFRFPRELAAQIAVDTVQQYRLQSNSQLTIIFAVYSQEDIKIYQKILREKGMIEHD